MTLPHEKDRESEHTSLPYINNPYAAPPIPAEQEALPTVTRQKPHHFLSVVAMTGSISFLLFGVIDLLNQLTNAKELLTGTSAIPTALLQLLYFGTAGIWALASRFFWRENYQFGNLFLFLGATTLLLMQFFR